MLYAVPTFLRRGLLWVDIFLFHPDTESKPEHQPELEGASFRTVFSSPFFLIYKLSVAVTGRLTTWFALARASCLTPLRLETFNHPLTRIVVVPLDIEPFLVLCR